MWANMEFRVAHQFAMNDRRLSLILIIYGDIDNIELDKADPAFQLYIKTNSYIKWDDPWFMSKLINAMPDKVKTKDQLN